MSTVNVELFGKDPKVQKAISIARNVSVTKATILIVGEVGIGKRTLGRFVHESSNRALKPLEIVDCSGDSKTVENRILGFRDEGTGRFHKGVLETASGGTVILANVDGLDENFQKRLHKILNELNDYDLDIRLISTTTKNISKLVGSGRFYRGLFTFISSNAVHLPPLREREGDLEMLTQHFLNEYSIVEGERIEIHSEAMNKLIGHYWAHNVEELKSVLLNGIENMEDAVLTESALAIGEKRVENFISEEDNEGIRLMSLKEAEKLLIKKALIHTSENRTQAAKILGVSIRTLRNKINEYRSTGNAYFMNLR